MADLHTAPVIDDADLADDVELPARLAGATGLLRITLAKIKTYLQGAGFFGYRVGFYWTTVLAANEIVLIHTFTKEVTFADDFAGSHGAVDGVNPGATQTLDVQKNGVSVGTISISTGGVMSFVTAAAEVTFAVGDRMKIVGQAAVATTTNASGTLEGTY